MLKNFIEFVEKRQLNVDSIILTKSQKRYEHFFTDTQRNNIRSISKVLCCFGVNKAIRENFYNLESFVLDYFPDVPITNEMNVGFLSELKIKHLLNLTMGHSDGLMFSKDIKKLPEDTDFISYILNYDLQYHPGTHFVYNNASSYLLCAITQRLTKMYFGQWVYETVLKDLSIEEPVWEKTHQGICLGASGLYFSNEELHKIGIMMLNNGIYDGKQIIDKEWIEAMHKPQFITSNLDEYSKKQGRCINKMAYGYHIWISGNGTALYPKTHYFCDGTDGQFLIISPKQEMVITILSHQNDMNPFYEVLGEYLDY